MLTMNIYLPACATAGACRAARALRRRLCVATTKLVLAPKSLAVFATLVNYALSAQIYYYLIFCFLWPWRR